MSARIDPAFHKVTRVRKDTPRPPKAARTKAPSSAQGLRESPPPRLPPRPSSPRSASPTEATKKRKHQAEDELVDAPPPAKKRGKPRERTTTPGVDDAPPPPVKNRGKQRQRTTTPGVENTVTPKRRRKAKDVPLDDDDNDDVQVDQSLVMPTWADPLIELDARASQATRLKEKYYQVYLQGRLIERLLGFCAPPDKIIAYAVAMHDVPRDDRPCRQSTGPHPDNTLELAHHALVDWFPDWDNAVPLLQDDPTLISKLGTYLGKVGGKTRSDDLVRLKKHVIWAAGIEDPKGVLAAKRNRGFHHHALGRLLCPKSKLEQFDEDPDKFCQAVLDGKEKLRSCDWWAGLYDLERALPGKFRPGLLMSDFGLTCFLVLFCSKNSFDYETTTNKKKKGQPSLARKYGLQKVTLLQIIYTMCLARFCITDIADWSPVDGAWSVREFVKSILDFAFKNPKWHTNLVDWWTRKIYGDAHDEEMGQDEYQQTAFYIAMNYEDDDNIEDDFEDRPRRVVKPKRRVGPVKRNSPPQKSPTPVPTPTRRVSPPEKAPTPVPAPPRRPGQTQIRRMTTPPVRPRYPTTPGSLREKTDPRSLEEYWDEQIANANQPRRAFWDDEGEGEKPEPSWDEDWSAAEELEQEADPDANEDEDEDAEGSQGMPAEEDASARQHSERVDANFWPEEGCDGAELEEQRGGINLHNEQRGGIGWHDEQDEWLREQDGSVDFNVKLEREGSAGLGADPGSDDEGSGVDQDARPMVSNADANEREDTPGTGTMDGTSRTGTGSKDASPRASPASLKAQLAAMLAEGATDDDLDPDQHKLLADALARFQELTKTKAAEAKKQRNKEKVMKKKREAGVVA